MAAEIVWVNVPFTMAEYDALKRKSTLMATGMVWEAVRRQPTMRGKPHGIGDRINPTPEEYQR